MLQAGPEPEPLEVEFVGESPLEAALLVKEVIAECADAGIPLHHVRVDPVVVDELRIRGIQPSGPVEADPDLHGRMALHRRSLT